MGCCTYKQTLQDKLKDIAETRKVTETLINHYTFILGNYDKIIAVHDKDIAIIEKAKAEVLKHFVEAPEKLKDLAKSLEGIQETRDVVIKKRQRIAQLKSLKERMANLRAECEADGIDVDKGLKDLEK